MEALQTFLVQHLGDNALADLRVAGGTFVVLLCALWVLKAQLLVRLNRIAKKSKAQFDDVIVETLQAVSTPFLVVVSLFTSVQHMELPTAIYKVLHAVFLLMLVFEGIKLLEKAVTHILSKALSKGKEEKKTSAAITLTVRVVLWSVGLLMILSNLGFNVNSLIASLGIGGIAVALALQNILGDIFSSYSIIIDKPFEEGDFIVAGEHKGIVTHIGLKTTRIQALQGEEIVISNAELTSARLSNFKKLKQRRIVFVVTAEYGTPVSKLKKIPGMIKKIIAAEKDAKFERVHFTTMNDYSLDFEVVYHVNNSDYEVYLKAQQNINLAILKAFEDEKINMPYPTQTVHVNKEA